MNPVGYFEFEMDEDARNAPYVHKSEELKLILASIRSLGVDALLDWLKDLVRFHPEPDHPPLFLSGINCIGRSGGKAPDRMRWAFQKRRAAIGLEACLRQLISQSSLIQARGNELLFPCYFEVMFEVLFEDVHRLMKDRDVRYTFWDYLKKDRWGCLRRKLRVRAIVLYWLKLTESLMEPGNAAFARDHAEWDAMWE